MVIMTIMYPLVNEHNNYGKIHHFQWQDLHKFTISTGPFSSSQTVQLPEGNLW